MLYVTDAWNLLNTLMDIHWIDRHPMIQDDISHFLKSYTFIFLFGWPNGTGFLEPIPLYFLDWTKQFSFFTVIFSDQRQLDRQGKTKKIDMKYESISLDDITTQL